MNKSSIALLSALLLSITLVLLAFMDRRGPEPSGLVQELAAPLNPEASSEFFQLASRMRADRRVLEAVGPNLSELAAPLSAGRWLRVVSAASGEPLPGALVTWRSAVIPGQRLALAPGDMLVRYSRKSDPEREFRKRGTTWLADESGGVLLPKEPGLVMGRHGDLWLMRELRGNPESEASLALEQDTTVNLRVLDSRGVPVAGVDVRLFNRTGVEVWPLEDARMTPANGEVAFPHVGYRLRAMTSEGSRDFEPDSSFFLCAYVQASDLPRVPIDLERPVGGRVDLVLPPTGSVVVRVVNEQGEPHAGRFQTYLKDRDAVEGTFPGDLANSYQRARNVPGNGVVRYPAVGVGTRLVAKSVGAGGASFHAVEFEGPSRVGEEVLVSVVVPGAPPFLQMRVVSEGGIPLPEGERLLVLLERTRGSEVRRARGQWGVDADGEFSLRGLPRLPLAVGDHCEVWLSQYGTGPLLVGHRKWPMALSKGVNDLGEVLFVQEPVLASGRVVDHRGLPIVGARLSGKPSPASSPPPDPSRLRFGRDPRCTTGEDGKFILRGTCDGTHMSLTCRSLDQLVGLVEDVPVGARDLTVVLAASGDIVGSVALPGKEFADSVSLYARPADAKRGPRDPHGCRAARQAYPALDGSFVFRALAPGEYDVLAFLNNLQDPLVEVSGVQVAADQVTRDFRLDPIDLRRLKRFELTFEGEGGEPIPAGDLIVCKTGDPDEHAFVEYFTGGRKVIVGPDPVVDLHVEAQGYRSTDVSGVTGDTRIEMKPPLTVRLALDADSPLPSRAWTIELDLDFVGDELNDRWGSRAYSSAEELDTRGEGVWRFDRGGAWRVESELLYGGDSGATAFLDAFVIEVKDTSVEQRIEFHLSPEALEAALVECRNAARLR